MNAVASRNIKFVSHSDLGGRGDGVQIMLHRGFAYIGHGYSNGITTVDVRDAKNPKPRNHFTELFHIDHGKIRDVHAAFHYPPDNLPVPNWPPYDGLFPLPASYR